ncbi:MAG TPA: hypothetical protein VMZ53_23735, partial [Kofleriaceae bacterium]|nr:hypothetical protein [Kofleriaceae bacterium]
YLNVTVQAKKRRVVGGFIDTGSGMTILSNLAAEALGIDTSKPTDYTHVGGFRRDICFAIVDIHIPGTDCFVEGFRVAVIANGAEDIPGALIGADFLQRTGALLDFRKGRHSIAGDVEGRDSAPEPFVRAKPVRVRRSRS